jgi:DNA-directed RNA polymerase subunit RPC12/RpoP
MGTTTWVCRHCGSAHLAEDGTLPETFPLGELGTGADGEPVPADDYGLDGDIVWDGYELICYRCIDCGARADSLAALVRRSGA